MPVAAKICLQDWDPITPCVHHPALTSRLLYILAWKCDTVHSTCALQCLMMRGETDLHQPWGKFLALGLGLLHLGRQMAIEATHEV